MGELLEFNFVIMSLKPFKAAQPIIEEKVSKLIIIFLHYSLCNATVGLGSNSQSQIF